jgi:putative tricarboxylic transport membrane protein
VLIDNAISALAIVFDPARFAVICFGVVLGLIVGVMPGIGGLGGMALLIPFTYSLDPHTALAFLIGMWAVTATSDTVPAILFGVPGAIGSASTVLDGYPMARRGEAGRAFGASFTSSALGGLFGALLLGISIPVLRPFMLAIGTPELLAVCILGLTLVAAVSQGAILKGLVTAIFGVLLAAVGNEAQTGALRWTLGTTYLWDGVPIETLALGLFALPELVDMAIARRSIASEYRAGLIREQLRGVRDVLANWRLVLHSSSIGVLLGSIPGMGAPVIDWIAYGSAARLFKGAAQSFGTGDVRGVICSEAANNAREGGALIPTLAFGVPSSASMALLMGAFLTQGIAPGPKLLTTQLDITFTLVWSLALANVLGAGICFLAANQLAKMVMIRAGVLVPCVVAIGFVGAYQGSRSFGDLVVLLAIGALGWIMKRFGWARAPLILGFILGKLIEKYLFISIGRYGLEWLERPAVLAIFAATALILARPLFGVALRRWRGDSAAPVPTPAAATATATATAAVSPVDHVAGPALWALAALGFAAAFWSATDWKLAARLMPQTAAAAGLLVVALAAGRTAIGAARGTPIAASRARSETPGALEGLSDAAVYGRLAVQALWLLGLLAGVALIGMLPALGLFMLLYMTVEGRTRLGTSLAIVLPLWAGMYVLFVKLLHVPWPPSLLGDALPWLRAASGRLI